MILRNLRVFVAGLGVEVNSFSPLLTDIDSFRALALYPAGTFPPHPAPSPALLWACRERAEKGEIELIEGLSAGAQPGGPLLRSCYAELAQELLNDLKNAEKVDVVLLGLHGAMSAEDLEDCEGDLLARARAIVGPNTVIAALLDSHATLTDKMVVAADILLAFKEYPHTDIMACGERLTALALSTALGEHRPISAVFDCRQLGAYHTFYEPMKSVVADIRAVEADGGALDISIIHGFLWADVEDGGTKVLVTTDDDEAGAQRLARQVGERLMAIRGTTSVSLIPMDAAIVRLQADGPSPVIVADTADNPGGGAPSDSTYLLHAFAEAGIRNVCAGLLWDPEVVEATVAAGVGSKLALGVGGKQCGLSGPPLHLEVRVLSIIQNASQMFGGVSWPVGTSVALEVPEYDWTLVISSVRSQCFVVEVFSDHGIDIRRKRVVLVKSSQHFAASFGQIAADIMVVDAPGVLDHDIHRIPYRHLRRPIWPLDPDLG